MNEENTKLLHEYWKHTIKSKIMKEVKTISGVLSKTGDEYLKFLYRIPYEVKTDKGRKKFM